MSWFGKEVGAVGQARCAVRWYELVSVGIVVTELATVQESFTPTMIESLKVCALLVSHETALPLLPTTVLNQNCDPVETALALNFAPTEFPAMTVFWML